MKILCVVSKYNYGDPKLGLGVEYVAFVSALQNLGHEVLHFDSLDCCMHSSPVALNKALLHTVAEERPDIVLTVQRDYELWIETLHAIHAAYGCLTITWATDDSFKFNKVSRFIGRHYNAITTTYDYRLKDYREKGISNVIATQWAANSAWLQPPLRASECAFQVSFVGANYGERGAIIKKLRSHGIHVECFGRGWPNGPIETADFPRIIRESVISLNFSAGYEGKGVNKNQIKARTFEIPGAGGFLLTEYSLGIEKYYELGKEVICFRSADELAGIIKYFLSHPQERDEIAKAGFSRTQREHTYERRFEIILNALSKVNAKLPVSNEETNLKDAITRYESSNALLKALRWSLLKAGTTVWGTERGTKAARRLLFEASWRVFGERTFTASGLPGRLFPGI